MNMLNRLKSSISSSNIRNTISNLQKCSERDELLTPANILKVQEDWFKTWFDYPVSSGVLHGIAYSEILVDPRRNLKDQLKTLENLEIQDGETQNEKVEQETQNIHKNEHDGEGVTVVLAHGYGLGSSMWAVNINDIVKIPNVRRIICFDWPGMGASDRVTGKNSPRRSPKTDTVDSIGSTSLEEFIRIFNAKREKELLLQQEKEEEEGDKIVAIDQSTVIDENNQSTDVDNITTTEATTPDDTTTTEKLWTSSDAISFFVTPVDLLLDDLNVQNCVLVGHSLGGYLSAIYSILFPKRISSLILASPVGVVGSLKSSELTNSVLKTKPGLRLLSSIWNSSFTVQSIPRNLPEKYARNLMSPFAKHIFATQYTDLSEEQQTLIQDYLFRITTAPPCGEYALNSVLTLGINDTQKIFSIDPANRIEETIHNDATTTTATTEVENALVTVQARLPLQDILDKLPTNTHFIYGEYDWLLRPEIIPIFAKLIVKKLTPTSASISSLISDKDKMEYIESMKSLLYDLREAKDNLTNAKKAYKDQVAYVSAHLEKNGSKKSGNGVNNGNGNSKDTPSTGTVTDIQLTAISDSIVEKLQVGSTDILPEIQELFITYEKLYQCEQDLIISSQLYDSCIAILSGMVTAHGLLSIVPNAGHHLYSNNPKGFFDVVQQSLAQHRTAQTMSLIENEVTLMEKQREKVVDDTPNLTLFETKNNIGVITSIVNRKKFQQYQQYILANGSLSENRLLNNHLVVKKPNPPSNTQQNFMSTFALRKAAMTKKWSQNMSNHMVNVRQKLHIYNRLKTIFSVHKKTIGKNAVTDVADKPKYCRFALLMFTEEELNQNRSTRQSMLKASNIARQIKLALNKKTNQNTKQ